MITENVLKIGQNMIDHIFEILDEKKISGKFLYVSDPFVDKLYGQIVKEQLAELGRVKVEYVNNNTISYAMNLAERMIATDIDYIVGLGGGKVLDVCKYAAYISKRPFISVPTTMANDGIASPIAVLKRKDGKPKSLGCAMASVIIIDTLLIQNSPIQLIKAGIGDTISNYMALKDWNIACERKKDSMNDFAYLMSKNSLDALLQTQYNTIGTEFINVLANSIVLSGIATSFTGNSRPVSGSEHLFSHALDYYSNVQNLHGIQVALGTIAVLKLIGFEYQNVLQYLRKFEVDINPIRLGITEDDFVLCMQKATSMRTNRYTYLNEADLSESTLKKVYHELQEEL